LWVRGLTRCVEPKGIAKAPPLRAWDVGYIFQIHICCVTVYPCLLLVMQQIRRDQTRREGTAHREMISQGQLPLSDLPLPAAMLLRDLTRACYWELISRGALRRSAEAPGLGRGAREGKGPRIASVLPARPDDMHTGAEQLARAVTRSQLRWRPGLSINESTRGQSVPTRAQNPHRREHLDTDLTPSLVQAVAIWPRHAMAVPHLATRAATRRPGLQDNARPNDSP
jgi:hypothetical protein